MRMTFGQQVGAAQDYAVDPTAVTQTGLSTTLNFLKREVNSSVKDLFVLMKKYSLQPLPRTASTVNGQIWYHNPPGLSKIETVTIPLGNIVLPLRVIHSQEEWDRLHIVPITSNYPEAVFPRRDDFGIYPTPSSAVTMTLVGNYMPVSMTADDYSTGTVSVTQNSATITGSGTVWTVDMVGRYFFLTDSLGQSSGNWYRIAAFVSSTELTLETFFEESTGSSLTYVIGQSPDIPEELHEFIPHRAAGIYYGSRRRDLEQSQRELNYYYTGDYANGNRRGNIRGGVLAVLKDLQEKGRGNSQLTEMAGSKRSPLLMGGIWTTVITPS